MIYRYVLTCNNPAIMLPKVGGAKRISYYIRCGSIRFNPQISDVVVYVSIFKHLSLSIYIYIPLPLSLSLYKYDYNIYIYT